MTLKCVNILLEYGWKIIELDLAKQLLILFTFIAGGVPGNVVSATPEEILSIAYNGLAILLQDVYRTPGGVASMVDAGTLPALGHSLTVILEGVTAGPSPDVQLHALGALDAVWRCVRDQEALAGFLPGTISGLIKCLVLTTTIKRTKTTLIKAMGILEHVLVTALGDMHTRNIRAQQQSSSEAGITAPNQKVLSPSWLKASTAQIKLALSNVIHLRKHKSQEVRDALNQLCLRLLDECHETLSQSVPMLVETSMTLDSNANEDESPSMKTSLVDLAMIYSDIGLQIKSVVYNWVTSLPRKMQSNDENAKILALKQISGAHKLFARLDLESSVLESSLASALRDCITLNLDATKTSSYVKETAFSIESQAALALIKSSSAMQHFRPIFYANQHQREIFDSLKNLVANSGNQNTRLNLARDMLDYARGGMTGTPFISSFWLASEMLKSLSQSEKELNEFLESSITSSAAQNDFQEELYTFAVIALAESEDNTDWRVQAVALEVVAHVAQQQKEKFRTELIDVLYLITQSLGSAYPQLREHAITTLNKIAIACAYKSTGDMIIDNADYMVNAISLRLNTFDISPAAPQVLVMMIRLTGPSLLLYLDDVVGSIFAALDNFHGYSMLVESLFSVLGEIVTIGSKSNLLEIEPTPAISQFQPRSIPPTIDDIISALISKRQQPEIENVLLHQDFPQTPWKSAKTLLDEATIKTPDEDEEDDRKSSLESPASEEMSNRLTKTQTLICRITQQTQHHLTSSSPHLRTNLLKLVATSILSLPSSSVDFLPLINDIWPVVLARLYDTEPYVSIAAAEALSAICKPAGDFLNTRIQTEWVHITGFAKQKRVEAERERKGKGGRGMFSMASKVWEAVMVLLVDIVGYVGVGDRMFDHVLEIIGINVLLTKGDLMGKVSGRKGNADAVWLAVEMAREEKSLKTPDMEEFVFAEIPKRVAA